jgi:hypothetical protein
MVDGNSAFNTDEVSLHSLNQPQHLINHVFLPAVTGADVISAFHRFE